MAADAQKRVLIIDDDENIAELLRYMIERAGFDPMVCADGREAGRCIVDTDAPPALILLDIVMPYATGYEVLASIRSKPGWESVPVFMLTSKQKEGDIVKALDAGADDYIVKPFQPAELMARLRRTLEKGHAR